MYKNFNLTCECYLNFVFQINQGHALAFGCVIAMSCDYRIMDESDNYKIGLNAVLLVVCYSKIKFYN